MSSGTGITVGATKAAIPAAKNTKDDGASSEGRLSRPSSGKNKGAY